MTRLNQVIARLEQGQTVVSTLPVANGAIDDFAMLSASPYDMVMIEMEHHGYDSRLLRTSLQYLMDRRRIAADGPAPPPTPLVRIPPNAREKNEFVIKQALDTGVMGLVLPHLDTVEGAASAVRAARYPAARGSTRAGPDGVRGWAPFTAARYWGLSTEDYYERADIWPLNPDGEILLMGIVESVAGIAALPQILKEVKGIGAIWAGSGDLSVSMGLRGEAEHPDVEREVLGILAICKDHGVACAVPGGGRTSVTERIDQGFEIVLAPYFNSLAFVTQALQHAGRLDAPGGR